MQSTIRQDLVVIHGTLPQKPLEHMSQSWNSTVDDVRCWKPVLLFFYRKSIWQLFFWFYSLYIIDTRLYIIPYFMLYSNNKQPSDQLSLATNMGPPLPSDRWNQDGLLGVWVQGGRITQSQNVEHGFANWVPSDLEQILNGGYSRWYSISMREFGLI